MLACVLVCVGVCVSVCMQTCWWSQRYVDVPATCAMAGEMSPMALRRSMAVPADSGFDSAMLCDDPNLGIMFGFELCCPSVK